MKLAVVRVRGVRKISPRINKTFVHLRLLRPNHCVLVDDTPQNMGMLLKVKDYVTFGPIDEVTLLKLLTKKGEKGSALVRSLVKSEELTKMSKEIFGGKKTAEFVDPVFRLRPPSKGYKNIKRPYPEGDLGSREEMNSLIKRMI
ncbi:uL30 family ribosomal protein [Candidatus Micrarchaeota archaeon]|nr:uL30 family ribosomal protein [Candidatus Micrarchaeota archaeon]